MADLKQIAERAKDWPGTVEHREVWRLGEAFLCLLEENTRLRDAVDRAAGMLENACKQSCEPFRPYGKHAPECHWDIAEELREALGKGEGTASE